MKVQDGGYRRSTIRMALHPTKNGDTTYAEPQGLDFIVLREMVLVEYQDP